MGETMRVAFLLGEARLLGQVPDSGGVFGRVYTDAAGTEYIHVGDGRSEGGAEMAFVRRYDPKASYPFVVGMTGETFEPLPDGCRRR